MGSIYLLSEILAPITKARSEDSNEPEYLGSIARAVSLSLLAHASMEVNES